MSEDLQGRINDLLTQVDGHKIKINELELKVRQFQAKATVEERYKENAQSAADAYLEVIEKLADKLKG